MNNFWQKGKTTINNLQEQLESNGIDTSKWGKWKAKTLEHLQKEIDSGETILVVQNTGELLRQVLVGSSDVYYKDFFKGEYRLKEEKQVFKDGRERRRELPQSLSEKLKHDENPREAMIRGIKEELGINGEIELTELWVDKVILNSPSYPGLSSEYLCYKFKTKLNNKQFNPNGYIENQLDKSTYFVWEKLDRKWFFPSAFVLIKEKLMFFKNK